MIEYGTFINNQLIKHKSYHDGDKPLTYTEMPTAEGYRALFHWQEKEAEIVQIWELVEDDSEYEDIPTAEETLSILLGGTL